jgi:hypothetical protein
MASECSIPQPGVSILLHPGRVAALPSDPTRKLKYLSWLRQSLNLFAGRHPRARSSFYAQVCLIAFLIIYRWCPLQSVHALSIIFYYVLPILLNRVSCYRAQSMLSVYVPAVFCLFSFYYFITKRSFEKCKFSENYNMFWIKKHCCIALNKWVVWHLLTVCPHF